MICIDLGTHTTKALAFPEGQFSGEKLLSSEVTTLRTSILLKNDDRYSFGAAADSQLTLDNVLSCSSGFNRCLGCGSPIALTNYQGVIQYFSPDDLLFRLFSEVRDVWRRKGCDLKELSTVALSFPAGYTPSLFSDLHKVAELSGFCRVLFVPEGEAAACCFSHIHKTDMGENILVADWGWESLRLYLLHKDAWGRYVLKEEYSEIIPDTGNQIIANSLIRLFMNENGITDEVLSDNPYLCCCIENQVNNGVLQLLQRHVISIRLQAKSVNYLFSISQNQYRDAAKQASQKVKEQIERFLSKIPSVLSPRNVLFTGGGSQYPFVYDFITSSLPRLGWNGDSVLNSEAVIRGLGIHAAKYASSQFYHEKYV